MPRFLERAIADVRLRPGDRLAPQSQLAKQLGLDLTTITRAFAKGAARSLIHARGTLETFVMVALVLVTLGGPVLFCLGEMV